MELIKIWEIIWRRRLIIILVFLGISLTTIVGSYFLTPIYKASAKIQSKSLDTPSSFLLNIGLQGIPTTSSLNKDTEEIITETNIVLATVDPVLEKVITRLQLRNHKGNLMKPSDLRKSNFIISIIFPEPYVEANPIEDSIDLLEIKAESPDPKEAAMIANAVAEAYIDENLKQRRREFGNARTFIEEQIKIARADYLNALEEIRNFKIIKETVDLDKETNVAIDKMAELMKEKEATISNINETRVKIATLKIQLSRQSEMVVSSSTIKDNPQIEELKKRLIDLELQLVEGLTEKTQDHPDIIILQQKIKKARGELKREVDIFGESSKDLETMERELSALESHLKDVNINISKHSTYLYNLPVKSYGKSQLEVKLSAGKEIYSSMLEYLYRLGVAEAMTFSDIRLVESATEPNIDKPVIPDKILNGIIGIMLGLMFGFGIAFLIEYVDDTIKTPEQVKEYGLTLLGTIPRFRRKKSKIISERDPKDTISESYRVARSNIKFFSPDKPINSLLVTSFLYGEGKTTSAVNLAISIVREEKRVLLIDMDLRKPEIHRIFGIPNSGGISSLAAAEARLEETIIKTGVEGLSILTSGPIPTDPGRLIESQKMQHLIKELSQKYDFIIMDSPPVLVAHDAIVLAGYVDGVVLILESRKITRRDISRITEFFRQVNIQLIGAILNKFKN